LNEVCPEYSLPYLQQRRQEIKKVQTLKTKMNERFTVRIKEAFGNFEILLFDLRFIIYTDAGGYVKKAIGVFGISYKHCLVMVEFGTGMLRRYIRNYNQN
jgi:hypothetical protein